MPPNVSASTRPPGVTTTDSGTSNPNEAASASRVRAPVAGSIRMSPLAAITAWPAGSSARSCTRPIAPATTVCRRESTSMRMSLPPLPLSATRRSPLPVCATATGKRRAAEPPRRAETPFAANTVCRPEVGSTSNMAGAPSSPAALGKSRRPSDETAMPSGSRTEGPPENSEIWLSESSRRRPVLRSSLTRWPASPEAPSKLATIASPGFPAAAGALTARTGAASATTSHRKSRALSIRNYNPVEIGQLRLNPAAQRGPRRNRGRRRPPPPCP